MRLSALLLFIAATLIGDPLRAADAPRPNVLLIAIDDLNDWVGFLEGHPQIKTPNMDELARRGTVFAKAYCASPLCCPSRAAVFSGRQPFHTGVYGNEDDIRDKAPSLTLLPQHFRAAGYRTSGCGKLLHQNRPDLFDESFFPEQRWSPFKPKEVEYTPEEQPTKGGPRPRHVVRRGGQEIILPLNGMPSDRAPKTKGGESFDWGPLDVEDDAMGDAAVADWASERLRRQQSSPFFLAVGFYRPHIPLFAPQKYFKPFPIESIVLPDSPADDLDDLGELGRKIALEADTAGLHATVVKHDQWKQAVAAYLACVTFIDAQVGKLVKALESGPHHGNTIVMLFSDHGWHLGEKQHWGKRTPWERSARVPLVIAPPSRSTALMPPGVCNEPVGLIDVYPTLIELCGLPAVDGLDGTSLTRLMRDPLLTTDRAIITTIDRGNYSVRDTLWRWIRYRDGSEELYDHKNDSRELKNLADDASLASVKTRLAQYLPQSGAN